MNDTRKKIELGECDEMLVTLYDGCLTLLANGDPYGTATADLLVIKARIREIAGLDEDCEFTLDTDDL